jgi:hypothetical protein
MRAEHTLVAPRWHGLVKGRWVGLEYWALAQEATVAMGSSVA